MPYADAKYPAGRVVIEELIYVCRCAEADLIGMLDLCESQPARQTIEEIRKAIAKAQGGDAWDASMVGQTPR